MLTDTSTNGVFINDPNNLLGNGAEVVLYVGMRFFIGEYTFVVDDIMIDNGVVDASNE